MYYDYLRVPYLICTITAGLAGLMLGHNLKRKNYAWSSFYGFIILVNYEISNFILLMYS